MNKTQTIQKAKELLRSSNDARKKAETSDDGAKLAQYQAASTQYQAAEAEYIKASSMDGAGDDHIEKDLKSVYQNLSNCFYNIAILSGDKLKETDAAIKKYESVDQKYLDSSKINLSAIYSLDGSTKREAGDYDGAIASLNKALEFNKDSSTSQYELALAYKGAKSWAEAIVALEKTIEMGNNKGLDPAKGGIPADKILNFYTQIFGIQSEEMKLEYGEMEANLKTAFEYLKDNNDKIATDEEDAKTICLNYAKAKCFAKDFKLDDIKAIFEVRYTDSDIYTIIEEDAASREKDGEAKYLDLMLGFQSLGGAAAINAHYHLLEKYRLKSTKVLGDDYKFTADDFVDA